jgi:3-phosphoshikimate 1-carboxyvinyltransferase
MRISVHKSKISGAAQAPSSKSYTIRSLMCAAMANGHSELIYPLVSDDTGAASNVLNNIGVKMSLQPDCWQITGGRFSAPSKELFCGDSAATLRFMSAICALVPGKCKLTAGSSLSQRPVKAIVDALKMWGVDILSANGSTPLIVNGGELSGGYTELPGNISSQYVSALLLVAPRATKNSKLRLTTPLESRSYVLMTLECMRKFGVDIQYSDDLMKYEVSPQEYHPIKYTVEGDWSSASYLLGLGALAGEIKIENLNPSSLQGDKKIIELLRNMGAQVQVNPDTIIVKSDRLKSIKADLNDCIDLLPTVAVLAALAEGTSEFTGVRRARIKESDRISSMREGLERIGIKVNEETDRLAIQGGEPHYAIIDSKNDHRVAMAFSLIGVAKGSITLDGVECVSKTYPDYWQTLRHLGVKLNEQ